ncbi:nicastrin [Megalopta genalis]|uniref:nicastrin n=1 Tax=Megalopta genalis TaxID=115081 RepID=UPI0014438281|nr:nicastrin [Megalopta genalis]
MARCFCLGYLFIFVIINLAAAIRVKDMIYTSFEGVSACFRRHNGTHQFGCSSSRSGSIGVVHLVEREEDVRWLEHNSTAGPYTVVLPFSMFTKNVLFRLRDTKNINGVLLAKNVSQPYPDSYSPEDTCPNRYSGFKNCTDSSPWNPYGSSLLLEDWPFPMFYIENETRIEEVKSCFFKYNKHDLESQRQRPLCALEMKSFMFAAVDSGTCIRRNDFNLHIDPILYCDPLGDRNIHWPLTPLNKDDKNSIILVTARLDASSLFDRISPGAENVVTGLVTLLATAYHLNNLFKNATLASNRNIVFSLFNGEAFDYIGSSRLIYDLKEGHFHALGGVKLKFDDIESVIEFGQLSKENVYLHSNNGRNNTLIESLQKELHADVLEDSIPPTSIQSFLKEKPDLPAVVISNHRAQFRNKYYNGILDDAQNLYFNKTDSDALTAALAKIAISVAEVLYKNVTEKSTPPINETTRTDIEYHISEMLSCYLKSAKCKLFLAASPPGAKLINQVLPLYVGVHKVLNTATTLTGLLLAFLTRQELNMNETTCYEKHLIWMAGYNCSGICINSTVNYSAAMSPAFIIDGYNMKLKTYSTWTESIWETLSVRMFLKPPESTQRLSMILGSVVAVMSFILVWFIESRSDILFNTRRATDG